MLSIQFRWWCPTSVVEPRRGTTAGGFSTQGSTDVVASPRPTPATPSQAATPSEYLHHINSTALSSSYRNNTPATRYHGTALHHGLFEDAAKRGRLASNHECWRGLGAHQQEGSRETLGQQCCGGGGKQKRQPRGQPQKHGIQSLQAGRHRGDCSCRATFAGAGAADERQQTAGAFVCRLHQCCGVVLFRSLMGYSTPPPPNCRLH